MLSWRISYDFRKKSFLCRKDCMVKPSAEDLVGNHLRTNAVIQNKTFAVRGIIVAAFLSDQ